MSQQEKGVTFKDSFKKTIKIIYLSLILLFYFYFYPPDSLEIVGVIISKAIVQLLH